MKQFYFTIRMLPILIVAFLIMPSSFAQEYKSSSENQDNAFISHSGTILNKFEDLKLSDYMDTNNYPNDYIFVNSSGWLSFDKDFSLETFIEIGEAASFISPITFINQSQTDNAYHVSYTATTIQNEKCVIVSWISDHINSQALLFENGDIEFRYNSNEQTSLALNSPQDYILGVVTNESSTGHFPFEVKSEKWTNISYEFITENKSLVFLKQKEETTLSNNQKLPKLFEINSDKGIFDPTRTTTLFNTDGNWTCPAGVTSVDAYCLGGGGGGFKTPNTNNYGGGGGGGGAFALGTITVIPGNTYAIVVGAGGGSSSDGGNSTFNGTNVVAEGGKKGVNNNGGLGGTVANSTGNVSRLKGGDGANGITGTRSGGGGSGSGTNNQGTDAVGTTGGIAPIGNPNGDGGNGLTASGIGLVGGAYGGAGSGGYGKRSNGGAGADGVVQLVYTIPLGTFDGTFSTGTSFEENGMNTIDDDTNYWMVGTDTHNGVPNSAYITNDGANNAYSTGTTQVSHFYFDYTFPAGATSIDLDFDWKGDGESSYDYLEVFLVGTGTTPVAGTQLSTGEISTGYYNQQTTWQAQNIAINTANAGTTQRLVFSWRNDGSGGTQPPMAVDNIAITSVVPATCSGTPAAGAAASDMASFCGTGSPTLTSTGFSTDAGVTFQWQSSTDNSTWANITGATTVPYTVAPAITGTTYFRLVATCTNGGGIGNSSSVLVTNTSETITGTNSPVNIVCNTTANMTATASGGTISWYADATGGTALTTGGAYSTNVTQNTTFYVETVGTGGTSTANVGETTYDSGDGYYGSNGTGLVFDAISNITIVSTNVYVQTAGSDVIVNLVNSAGTTIQTATFTSLGSGVQTLTLNFPVNTGTDYRLVSGNTTNLARDFTGVSFPYTLAGACDITGGWLSSASTTYYFFYDWVVSSSAGCASARIPIDVVVTSGENKPDCSANPSPFDGATMLDPNATTFSWDASNTDCQQATSYLLFFGTDNPPTNLINGTDIGNVLTYNPGALTAPETYYWRVVPKNALGIASGCAINTFTTSLAYCTSSATSTSDMDITNVTFGTINNSSNNISLTGTQGTATGTASKYSDWTASTVPVPSFAQGETASFSVTIDDSGSEYSHRVDVWIDYNQDGDFLDAGEEIAIFPYANPTTPNTTTVNITIPAGALTGSTRMRVVVVESSTTSPCGTYTWGETEDYIIDIGVPGTNTITVGPVGIEPATISTTIDTQAESVLNFDFVITDDGLTPATDNLQTLIHQMIFTQGTGNSILDWSTAIAGAELTDSDGESQLATTIAANYIEFVGMDYSGGGNNLGEIDDNTNQTYTLTIWLNCPLDGLTEGDNFVFEITGSTIGLVVPGSGFNPGENENSGATNNALDVIATQLVFKEQPTDTEINKNMFPKVTLAAVDDCGMSDSDFTGTVSLTSTGTMSGDPLTVALTNGEAIFIVNHTASGSGLTLDASLAGLTSVTSDLFAIYISNCEITTVPASVDGEVFVCAGTSIDFAGTYSGSGNTATSYTWDMGDGNEETTQDVNNYNFSSDAGYFIQVTVPYTGTTSGTCVTYVRVMVSSGPAIGSIATGLTSCDGGDYTLSASGGAGSAIEVTSFSGTGAVGLSLAQETFLPDGSGASYNSVLTYTQFDPAATLTAANLLTVYANLEHSYFGDLYIDITCPNGQTIRLANGYDGGSNSSTYLGEPIDVDANLDPGTGYEYRWTEVAPTYGIMSTFTAPTYTYTDNAGNTVTSHAYFPADTYTPNETFAGLVGCPLNGDWTISVTDNISSDNGYIFEWGLELDNSLMPGTWDYTAEIVSYDWTGAGVTEAHNTGAETTVTPVGLGNNIFTLTAIDNFGCSTIQDVVIASVICPPTWTGTIDNDWDDTGNWDNGTVPTCGGDDAVIPDVSGASNNFPIITIAAEANNLTIDANAIVTVATNGSLTVCGMLVNTPGLTGLIIKSDATGDGSLIHSTAGVQASIERYIQGVNYSYIGSPITNATDAGIGIANPQYYQWDPTMQWMGMGADPYGVPSTIDYAPWSVASGALTVGRGYAYYHENQTLNFNGTVNVATVNLILSDQSGNTNDSDQGWNLISNPYASALNWNTVTTTGWDNQVEHAVYMFDDWSATAAQTNYKYYVPASGNGGSYGVGTADATWNIPVGQGFMVKAGRNNVALQILASDREHNDVQFYRESPVHPDFLRMSVSGNGPTDETVIRFIEGATVNFDGNYEARKLFPNSSSTPQVYSFTADNVKTAITTLPELNQSYDVNIGLASTAGAFIYNFMEVNFDNAKVYLEDKLTNTVINLKETPSYSFTHSGDIDNERFVLHFVMNTRPFSSAILEDQTLVQNENRFEYVLPQNSFVDNDFNDNLAYTARISEGGMLPSSISFDEETQTFRANSPEYGIYNITVTATDLSGEIAEQEFSISVQGISSSTGSELSKLVEVYPNPSEGVFTIISGDLFTEAEIKVNDITGKTVYKLQTDFVNNSKIDLTEYADGVYFLEIHAKGSEVIRKRIVIRK